MFSDIALVLFLSALTIFGAGAISVLKSDMTRIRRSISDTETMLRNIVLPCLCIQILSRADSIALETIFLQQQSLWIWVAMVIAALAEPLLGLLLLMFAFDNSSTKTKNKQGDNNTEVSTTSTTAATTTTTQEGGNASWFCSCCCSRSTAALLGTLCLSTSSLAMPMGIALSLELLHSSNFLDTTLGVNASIVRSLVVIMCVFRLSVERSFIRVVVTRCCCGEKTEESRTTNNNGSRGNGSDGKDDDDDDDDSSILKTLHRICGDNLPALVSAGLGLLFNSLGYGDVDVAGPIPFLIGCAETLGHGCVPYCCAIEGVELCCALLGAEDEEEKLESETQHDRGDADAEQQQNKDTRKNQNVEARYPEFSVHLFHLALRVAVAAFICWCIVLAHKLFDPSSSSSPINSSSSRRLQLMLSSTLFSVVVFCCSSGVFYPENLKRIMCAYSSSPLSGGTNVDDLVFWSVVRRSIARNIGAAFVLIPVVSVILVV